MTQPALHVVSEDGESVGKRLAEARRRTGLSLEQVSAATRVRRHYLAAIERDDLAALPGPVYARGYLRAYAAHLGVEVDLRAAPPPIERRSLSLAALAPFAAGRGVTLTRPLLAGAGLVLIAGLFLLYAWHEIESARLEGTIPSGSAAAAVSPPPIASPQPLPSLAPTAPPAPAPFVLALRATEHTWVSVTVDGKAVYAGFLEPGGQLSFTGHKISVATGKPSLQASVGGGDFAALAALSKEYSAET